jgi:SulP family sulfate permease
MGVRQATAPHGIRKYLPVLNWLPNYPARWLRHDLVAGLTTAAVVIPQSMAYATIAGLPVEMGLYAALVPMLVYALLGSSRVLSVSVTSTISMLTAAELAVVVQSGDPAEYMMVASTLAPLGHERMFFNLEQAVEAYQAKQWDAIGEANRQS